MKNKSFIMRSAILAAAAAGFSSQLHASGFALIENGASGQGNAYAGAAAVASDASTIWFNPAGMMLVGKDQIIVALHAVSPEFSFTNGNTVTGVATTVNGPDDDGSENAFVPNLFYLTTVDENLKFGLGINVPFGLATEYDKNWVGRYHSVKTELHTININPSIAFKTSEKVSIGAGINLMLADVTLTSAIDFGSLVGPGPEGDDGFADLTGDNFDEFGYGINLGLMYEINSGLRLGVAYRSKVTIDVEGDADFTVSPAARAVLGGAFSPDLFADQGLKASVTLPESLSVSVAADGEKVTLLADVTWTGWSSYEELRIQYDNAIQPDTVTSDSWKDVVRLSLGADYQYSDKLVIRGGWALDQTPIPSTERRTARNPGNTTRWISVGFTYMIDANLTFDLGYSHLFVSDTQINNTFESTQAPLNGTLNGVYDASVDILSAQLSWRL